MTGVYDNFQKAHLQEGKIAKINLLAMLLFQVTY